MQQTPLLAPEAQHEEWQEYYILTLRSSSLLAFLLGSWSCGSFSSQPSDFQTQRPLGTHSLISQRKRDQFFEAVSRQMGLTAVNMKACGFIMKTLSEPRVQKQSC